MNWGTGIDTYAVLILCMKEITNENVLYSTGNSTQGSAVTRMGRKSKTKDICVCMCVAWSRKRQLTPVFLPGKFHGQRSLAGYSLWGCKESDTTEHRQKQINNKIPRNF